MNTPKSQLSTARLSELVPPATSDEVTQAKMIMGINATPRDIVECIHQMRARPQMSVVSGLNKTSVKIVKERGTLPSRKELARKQLADIRAELGRLGKLIEELTPLISE